MRDQDDNFWFHAKKYSYGWGLPACWQGWATVIAYFGLVVVSILFAPPGARWIYIIMLSVLFIIVIFFTGERPLRWRWGKD